MTGQPATPTPNSTPTPSTPLAPPTTPIPTPTERLDQVMATTGMGSDTGVKVGVGALVQAEILHDKIVESGGRAYDRVTTDLNKAAHGAAVTTGSAILLGVSSFIVRETYYYFRPTPEMVREQGQHKAELERKRDEDRIRSERAKEELDKIKDRRAFRECLDSNSESCTLAPQGYPEECRKKARKLSLHEGGESEVVRMTKSFVTHSPWNKREIN